MKKLMFILASCMLISSCATNTSFNSFYQDHQKDSDFSFGLNSSLVASLLPDEDLQEIKPLLKKAKHVRVLIFSEEYDRKSDQFNRFIERSKFEKVVKVKDDEDGIAFFTLEDKDRIKEMVLEISTGDELVLVGLKTNMTQNQLNEIIQ